MCLNSKLINKIFNSNDFFLSRRISHAYLVSMLTVHSKSLGEIFKLNVKSLSTRDENSRICKESRS